MGAFRCYETTIVSVVAGTDSNLRRSPVDSLEYPSKATLTNDFDRILDVEIVQAHCPHLVVLSRLVVENNDSSADCEDDKSQ